MKVAIIGTQGLPAKYGGFETLVEYLVTNKISPAVEYTVFCSARDYAERPTEYNGARLKYVHVFHANGIHSIPYDIISFIKALRGYDSVLVLGTSGCVFLPVFRLLCPRKRLVVNIDGLEHRRAKWGRAARWFLRFSEAMAVRFADDIVVDNQAILDYVAATYNRPSTLIAYGADHARREVCESSQTEILAGYGLAPQGYDLALCRIEPENNCHVILDACAGAGRTTVFVGNWDRNHYGQQLRERYASTPHIRLIDAVYELDTLYALRRNCRVYLHGHSAGGTNPSLVEAMMLAAPVVAFDCPYNRETTEHAADYFHDSTSLLGLLDGRCDLPANGRKMQEIALRRYMWRNIVEQYEQLYL